MENNEFMKMQQLIKDAVDKYDVALSVYNQARKTENNWHSDTIHRLSKPFLNGHFTLAVVGKMSSGKSTFINALIGQNILPTGHFQTTSVITYIEHGECLEMNVVYADGHQTTISDAKDIKTSLKNLVAIPENYSNLPINDINRLISGGDDISEILKKKEGIEARTNLPVIDDEIWKEYIKSHSKKDIAKEVYIKTPMLEEFYGWRIVDTPGIGAIGGIQDETKALFAKVDDNGNKFVDAIIFLHSGADNIEDETTKRFVKEAIQQLTKDAKKRLFFVLTHASGSEFRTYKDDILNRVQSIYAEPFGIPNDRIQYVDSLLHRFQSEVRDPQTMAELEEMEGWDKKELDPMTELFLPLKRALKDDGLELNNENLRRKMKDWENFDKLNSVLNEFVKSEKENLMERILKLIEGDLVGFTGVLQNQIDDLEGGKNKIEKKKDEIQRKKTEYQKIVMRLQREASIKNVWEKFGFIDNSIKNLSDETSIERVRTAYLQILENVTFTEKELFDNIKHDFEDYCHGFDKEDLTLNSIDFDALEHSAEEASEKIVTDYSRPNRKGELLKKGGISSDAEYKTTYPYTRIKVDKEKKNREFTANVIKEARAAKNTFYEQLKEKVNILCESVENEINAKTKASEDELNVLEGQLNEKDSVIDSIQKKIQAIKAIKVR